MFGFVAEACCSTELVEADYDPFWIGAAGPLGREGGCYFWFTIASEPASALEGCIQRGII